MTARDWALAQLDHRRLPGWPPRTLRHPPGSPPSDARDLALAEQIYVGVVHNLLLLQHLIEHYSERRLKSIDPLVQKVLAVGLYQLRFLTRVPTSAAVNEAVEQAKRFGQTRAAGFVNAVLRKATRDPAPLLPDPSADPARFAEVALSHPRELFDRLSRLLGADDALKFCAHDNVEPPTTVRSTVMPAAPGVSVRPHEQPDLYVVEPAKKAVVAEWAQKGVAQVQDPTAAMVVPQCRCEPGQRVLDRCAGLGTKTLQLRDAVGESGRVTAMDPNPNRCHGLRELLAARGIANVAVYQSGRLAAVPELTGQQFDRVLVDAPCSNSGVLARRPEARYAQHKAALASLDELQQHILDDTAPHVKPGGLMVYSTCSVWPEENEQQVERFLARHPQFKLEDQRATLPSLGGDVDPTRYRDGGFYAVLRRS